MLHCDVRVEVTNDYISRLMTWSRSQLVNAEDWRCACQVLTAGVTERLAASSQARWRGDKWQSTGQTVSSDLKHPTDVCGHMLQPMPRSSTRVQFHRITPQVNSTSPKSRRAGET